MNILRSALLKPSHLAHQRRYCTTQLGELSAIVQRLCDETRPVNVVSEESAIERNPSVFF